MFFGRVLISPDIVDGLRREAASIPAILGQVAALVRAARAASRWPSPRSPRGAPTPPPGSSPCSSIPSIVAGVVTGLGSSGIGPWLILASPTSALDGTNAVLFDIEPGSLFFFVDLPDWAYFAAVLAGIAGSVVVCVRRFVRITA